MSAFPAAHPGICILCEGTFRPGDLIERNVFVIGPVRYQHAECPDPTALKPTETVCPACFTVKPCECDDQ